jgi:hypothetical protein
MIEPEELERQFFRTKSDSLRAASAELTVSKNFMHVATKTVTNALKVQLF